MGGAAIAYELGVTYYVSASDHFNENKEKDGVTFAVTSKPGEKLPQDVIEYGNQLKEKYNKNGDQSGVFVNPNGQMIVAGGFKNPTFRIEDKTVLSILCEIAEKFISRKINIEKLNNLLEEGKELDEQINEILQQIIKKGLDSK